MSESITVYQFLPELLGVLTGTVIGYFLANKAAARNSMKNINQTKVSLLDEIKHNQVAVHELSENNSFETKDHISRPFRKSAYQTAIASGDFAKMEHSIQHCLGELYHEIDAFEVYATTVENWMYGIIALQPEKQEDYKVFMKKLSESEQHAHYINKMNQLLEEAANVLDK
jgi:hypothetical protein